MRGLKAPFGGPTPVDSPGEAGSGSPDALERLLGSAGEQFLTFRLGDEEYGVPILAVQGIQAWRTPTPVPEAPPHLLGVANVRGAVVPVLDLRLRFALPASSPDGKTPLVVVSAEHPAGVRWGGLVVDAMCEVRTLAPEAVSFPPGVSRPGPGAVVRGIARAGEGMVVLLDVETLLGEGGAEAEGGGAPREGAGWGAAPV